MNRIIDLTETVILENNQSINKRETDRPPYGGRRLFMHTTPFLYSLNHIYSVSEVEIVFDNKKKTIHRGCTQENQCVIPRDLYNDIYSDEFTETYTITPEDYENATDCGGDCY